MTKDQEKILDELLASDSGMTGWELGFIENLDDNFRERELSEKQADRLAIVWDKVFG